MPDDASSSEDSGNSVTVLNSSTDENESSDEEELQELVTSSRGGGVTAPGPVSGTQLQKLKDSVLYELQKLEHSLSMSVSVHHTKFIHNLPPVGPIFFTHLAAAQLGQATVVSQIIIGSSSQSEASSRHGSDEIGIFGASGSTCFAG
ncbi:unnamed protein product [Arabis nemorensis]|uniref:Uncharacterized protein n=1 Tax=Arabis nemorensis TaxID=586526 RepID=A0A565BQS9_9BRAS|nr:unnamed protein product [Arabis nemorensis]